MRHSAACVLGSGAQDAPVSVDVSNEAGRGKGGLVVSVCLEEMFFCPHSSYSRQCGATVVIADLQAKNEISIAVLRSFCLIQGAA